MTEWRSYPLGELCSLRAGVAFKTADQGNASGEFPFIKVSDMNLSQNSIAIRDANNWVDTNYVKRTKAKTFPPGTVVFAKIGEALKHNRVRQIVRPTLIDNNMMGAIPNPEVVQRKFLYYMLSSFDIASTATGTALPYLTVSVLERQKFLVPPLGVQHRIASILSAYDDLIENNTRRIAIVEEMARRIYEEWFVRFRFRGPEQVRMVESDRGLIPKGWSICRLDDVLVLQRGFDLPRQVRTEGSFPIISATGESGTHKEFRVKGPGVVTGRSGSLGTVMYVDRDFWPLNTTLWVKEFKAGSPLYAFYVLQSIDLRGYNSGAAVPTLNRNDVHGLPVLKPASDVLLQFDETIGPMLALKRKLEQKNANLRATRDLLLPKLISGELDVSTLPEPEEAIAA